MPQLNPDPWLAILVMSWLVFLTILMPHINKLKLLEKPTIRHIYNNPPSWSWPWI